MEHMKNLDLQHYFSNCLFFSVNSLARSITKLTDKNFGKIGICPSEGFLLMLAIEKPGISQKELGEHLHLAQSTVSRFVDGMVREGYLEKSQEGKLAVVSATEKCKEFILEVKSAWRDTYKDYVEILGQEESDILTAAVRRADEKLNSK
jgi:DNA-binding MarR family transcriptional regulator